MLYLEGSVDYRRDNEQYHALCTGVNQTLQFPDVTVDTKTVNYYRNKPFPIIFTNKYCVTLNAFSLISYRGHFQKFQNWNFLHKSLLLSSQKYISPKEFSRNHFFMKLDPFQLKFTVFYGAGPMHIIMHNLQTKNQNQLKFWKYLLLLISSDFGIKRCCQNH